MTLYFPNLKRKTEKHFCPRKLQMSHQTLYGEVEEPVKMSSVVCLRFPVSFAFLCIHDDDECQFGLYSESYTGPCELWTWWCYVGISPALVLQQSCYPDESLTTCSAACDALVRSRKPSSLTISWNKDLVYQGVVTLENVETVFPKWVEL